MNILHVIPTLGCGGAEILVSNLAIQQAKEGHTVKIVILEPLHYTFHELNLAEELVQLVSIEEINTIVQISLLNRKIELSNNQFDEIIHAFSPQVIHSHLFQSELITRFKVYKNIKYFTHCHNNIEQFNFWNNKTFKRRITDFFEVKWLLSKYKECNNHFIVISKNTRDYFYKNLPSYFSKNIEYLPNAINASLYYKTEKIDQSTIKLITVGNLLENKGHLFLIEVIAELRKKQYKVQLEILGFGDMESVLQAKIDELKLTDCIFLRGNVPNVNDYLSDSDIYIHGAFKEAFGLVLIEAMASSLPVVTTAGGGNNELIVDDHNGFLIFNRDLNLFVEKVIYLIDNISDRLKIGNNAKEYSREYDIKAYSEKLIQLYRD